MALLRITTCIIIIPVIYVFITNRIFKYNTYKLQNNKTKLVVNHDEDYKSGKGTADGLKKNAEIELLGYDTNRDEMFDNVLTLVKYNYIYFEILEKRLSTNINNITFIDAEGNVFLKVDGLDLDFSNIFYQRLKEFKDVYNTDSSDLRLVDLQKDFHHVSYVYLFYLYYQYHMISLPQN